MESKKDFPQLGEIAGTQMPGNIPFYEYERLVQSLDGSRKDYRRFAKDSNKIVLEKFFLLNTLAISGKFVLLRPITSDGLLTFPLTKEIEKVNPEGDSFWAPVLLTLGIVICVSIGLITITSSFSDYPITIIPLIWAASITLPAWLLGKIIDWRHKAKIEKFVRENAQNPKNVFGSHPCSDPLEKRVIHDCIFRFYFKVTFGRFYKEQKRTIEITAAIVSKLKENKGKFVWLYCYDSSIVKSPAFSFFMEKNKWRSNRFIYSLNNLEGFQIIPAIETEHSFIFCLDHFTEAMEAEYGNLQNEAYEAVRSKGSGFSYDMFKKPTFED